MLDHGAREAGLFALRADLLRVVGERLRVEVIRRQVDEVTGEADGVRDSLPVGNLQLQRRIGPT